jgi:hypothetical protein
MFGLFRRRSSFGQEHSRAPRSAPPQRATLGVEVLEERAAPAVFNIANGDVTGLINAIKTANTNNQADTINLAAGGVYDLLTAQSASKGGDGLPDLTADNANPGNTLTINGNGATIQRDVAAPTFRILLVYGGVNTLNDVTISNGLSGVNYDGGGLRVQSGTLTLNRCTITNNLSNTGGFSNNGGGLGVRPNGTAILNNCLITGNTAESSGGGVSSYGMLTMTSCTVSGNTAISREGGGVAVRYYHNPNRQTTIVDCTITNNKTLNAAMGQGGGVADEGSNLTIQNSTITGNVSAANGGGVYAGPYLTNPSVQGMVTVGNSTIAANTATLAGGGMFINAGGATLNLVSTIISGDMAGTTGPDVNGTVVSQGNNLIGNTSGSAGLGASDLQNVNPMLGPLQNNGGPTATLALLAGSPAIDKGSNPAGLTTDQRGSGFNRTINGATDIGAYEFQPSATTTTLVSSLNPSAVGQSVTFTATVTAIAPGSDPLQGTVTFTIDGLPVAPMTLSGTSSSATVSFSTAVLAPGSHTITAQYSGFSVGSFSFGASSASLTQTVTGGTAAPAANFVAIAADAGGGPQVTVYNSATNAVVSVFFAFTPSFTGGVRVAVDDINGDGVQDIICAAGPGGGPQVEVIDGTKLTQLQSNGQIANSALITSFFAFNAPTFTGGVFVAAGQASSGQNWVVVGAGAGGGPQVTVYTAKALVTAGVGGTPASIANFFAFAPSFTGGVTVAVGDTTGSGKLNVIVGAGPGGGPQVIVVSGSTFGSGFATQSNGQVLNSSVLAKFFAFAPNFTGGVFVSGGVFAVQFNLIIGAGPGGGPEVIAVNGSQLTNLQSNGQIANSALLDNFFALPSGFMGGVRVGFDATFGSTPRAAILTAAGPSGSPEVNVFDALSQKSLVAFFFLPASFAGGAFVSG